ncbi:MAG: hypothetical protein QOF70_6172, partial [Acetobacteraceae bacterium]|nr:hypothetical protein [Acetobacteraceae bacterium]
DLSGQPESALEGLHEVHHSRRIVGSHRDRHRLWRPGQTGSEQWSSRLEPHGGRWRLNRSHARPVPQTGAPRVKKRARPRPSPLPVGKAPTAVVIERRAYACHPLTEQGRSRTGALTEQGRSPDRGIRTPNRRARIECAPARIKQMPVGKTTAGTTCVIPRCNPAVTGRKRVETAEAAPPGTAPVFATVRDTPGGCGRIR